MKQSIDPIDLKFLTFRNEKKKLSWKGANSWICCFFFFRQISSRTTWFHFIHKACRKSFDPLYNVKNQKTASRKRAPKVHVLEVINFDFFFIWRERKSNFVHGNRCASVELASEWNFNLSSGKINEATNNETKQHSRDNFDSVSTNYRVMERQQFP